MQRVPTVAILAGGLATRLGELTKKTPKSLLPIGGRPFLAWQLDLLAQQGFVDVVLCLGNHAEAIQDAVLEHTPAGMRVGYSMDGPRRLGTGGAVQAALPLLGESFLVMYGDSYLRGDYMAVYSHFERLRSQECPSPVGLMTVYHNENSYDSSNIVFRGGEVVRYEKNVRDPEASHIDWGLGILTREAFASFSGSEVFDLAEVYQRAVASRRLAAFEIGVRFFEIGSFEGLAGLRALLEGPEGEGRSA